jgi:hypothetical protein
MRVAGALLARFWAADASAAFPAAPDASFDLWRSLLFLLGKDQILEQLLKHAARALACLPQVGGAGSGMRERTEGAGGCAVVCGCGSCCRGFGTASSKEGKQKRAWEGGSSSGFGSTYMQAHTYTWQAIPSTDPSSCSLTHPTAGLPRAPPAHRSRRAARGTAQAAGAGHQAGAGGERWGGCAPGNRTGANPNRNKMLIVR